MLNSRTKILTTILLLILTILFGLWYYLGFFSQYNYFTAKNDIEEGQLRHLYIGEPALNTDAENAITNKYGFEYFSVGCIYSKQLDNSIQAYNKAIDKQLDKSNQAGWRERLRYQMDSLAFSQFNNETDIE